MAKNNLAERLVDLNEKIEEAKTEKSEYEGRRKSIKEALSKKYQCSTIEKAKELLEEKMADRTKKINVLRKGVEELEAEFE